MTASVKEVLVPLMIAILGTAAGSVLFVLCKSLWKSLMQRPRKEVVLLLIGITCAAVASVLVFLCVRLRKKMMERCGHAREPLTPRTAADESADQSLADGNAIMSEVEITIMNGDEAVDNPSDLAENRGVPEYVDAQHGDMLGRTEEMTRLQNGTMVSGESKPLYASNPAIKDLSMSLLINPTHIQPLSNANPAEVEMETLIAGEVPTHPSPA